MPVPDYIDTERTVEVPWIEQRLAGVRASALLDVGSAEAHYFGALAATGAHITLLEQRPFSLYHLHPAQIEVVFGDVTALSPDWDARFNVVTCVSVLDHVGLGRAAPGRGAALEQAVAELARVLSPGGLLLLTAPAGDDVIVTHRDGWPQRVFSLATVRRLFGASCWRWEVVETWALQDDTYVPCPVGAVCGCGYAVYRAEAVLAVAMRRL